MIRLQAATFADSANIREGLLGLLGGGLSVIRRPTYPAPMDAVFVMLVEISEEGPGASHQLSITLQSRDDHEVITDFSAEIGTLTGAEVDERGHVPIATLPVVLPLASALIPREGRYEVEVRGDGAVIGGARIDAVVLPDDNRFNPEWF